MKAQNEKGISKAMANEIVNKQCEQLRALGLDVELQEDGVLVVALPLPGQGTWENASGVAVCRVPVLIGLDVEEYPQRDEWFGQKHPHHAIHVPLLKYGGRELHDLCDCECDRSIRGWKWLRFGRQPPYMDAGSLVSVVSAVQYSLLERAAVLLSPDSPWH